MAQAKRLREVHYSPSHLPANPERNRYYLCGDVSAGRIVIARLHVKLQAPIGHPDCEADAGVYPARTHPSGGQYVVARNKSCCTNVSPPVPRWCTHRARCHRIILQLSVPVIPAATSNQVITETIAFRVEHIIRCECVQI